jgi:hypothetical protein
MNNYVYSFVIAVVIFGVIQYYVNNYCSDEQKELLDKSFNKILLFCGLLLLSYGLIYFIFNKYNLGTLGNLGGNLGNSNNSESDKSTKPSIFNLDNIMPIATSTNAGPSVVAVSSNSIDDSLNIVDDKLSLHDFENEFINSIQNQEVDVGLVPF